MNIQKLLAISCAVQTVAVNGLISLASFSQAECFSTYSAGFVVRLYSSISAILTFILPSRQHYFLTSLFLILYVEKMILHLLCQDQC